MKTVQCTSCFMQSCAGDGSQEKEYCPSHNFPDVFKAARKIYAEDTETNQLAKEAAIIESRGYMAWPRLKDIIELGRAMKYKKIVVLFCPDLWTEAKKTNHLLNESGFETTSLVCGVNKVTPQSPAAIASVVDSTQPDMILNAGLCIPFESEISKLIKVPMTTFIVRDKKLNNYPASAVYSSDKWRDWAKEVYRDKLGLE